MYVFDRVGQIFSPKRRDLQIFSRRFFEKTYERLNVLTYFWYVSYYVIHRRRGSRSTGGRSFIDSSSRCQLTLHIRMYMQIV